MYKFRNINGSDPNQFTKSIIYEDEKTDLQAVFDSYLAIASNTPFLLVFVLSFSKHLKRYSRTVSASHFDVYLLADSMKQSRIVLHLFACL